jgi:hypothetical protein
MGPRRAAVSEEMSARALPEIWIVSSEQGARVSLLAELIERGYDATGFLTIKDAIVRLIIARASRPALIVCDLHEQSLDGKVTAALFREGVPLVALAGALEAEDETIRALPWAELLRRPITIGAIADTVHRLVPPGG